MNDDLLQRTANITVILNAIYSFMNRGDIPRSKLRLLEPRKKQLEAQLWALLTGTTENVVVEDKETVQLIAEKVAEAKAALPEGKKKGRPAKVENKSV